MYEPLHGYLAVAVCVLGTLFNMINILVLTHKDMRSNPINILLTGIAVADILVMLEYIPFATHMYLLQGDFDFRSLEEKVYREKIYESQIQKRAQKNPSIFLSSPTSGACSFCFTLTSL